MRSALTISLALWALHAAADSVRVLVQSSPLAGSQYYALAEVRSEIRVGDALTLVREPDNRHDPNAVRIEWRGRKLGYLPRAENRTVAAAMDGGEKVWGRVARLGESADPWRRLEVEVYVDL